VSITILAIVDDLFFLAKIQQTARLVGATVEPVAPGKAVERARQIPVRAAFLDLNLRSGSALETLRAIKGDAKTRATRVIGFISHVQTDLATAAREAGCDTVMPRSTFTRRLPDLLRELA
jgi:CheY-like chemotaxis protein